MLSNTINHTMQSSKRDAALTLRNHGNNAVNLTKAKTMIIDSPQGLTDYFTSHACQNRVYGVFDGMLIVGWHKTPEEARKAANGLPVQVIYKSLGKE